MQRFNISSNKAFYDEMFINWEVNCYNTPLWYEIFQFYDAFIDQNTNKIKFNNSDKMELFYEHFNYEPDEQNNETQNKSLLFIEKTSWKKWVDYVFCDFENGNGNGKIKLFVELDENHLFIY